MPKSIARDRESRWRDNRALLSLYRRWKFGIAGFSAKKESSGKAGVLPSSTSARSPRSPIQSGSPNRRDGAEAIERASEDDDQQARIAASARASRGQHRPREQRAGSRNSARRSPDGAASWSTSSGNPPT